MIYLFRLLFFVVLILVVSCEKEADLKNAKKYTEDGVTFEYPGNWKVTEDSSSESFRYIFIEAPGSGVVAIEFYNLEDSFTLEEFAKLDVESLAVEMPSFFKVYQAKNYKNIERKIEENVFEGLGYEIDISLFGLDVPHTNELFMISSDQKAAYLSLQIATEDAHLVLGGFNLILSSFECCKQ